MQTLIWIYVVGWVLMYLNGIVRGVRTGNLQGVARLGFKGYADFFISHAVIALLWPLAILVGIFRVLSGIFIIGWKMIRNE